MTLLNGKLLKEVFSKAVYTSLYSSQGEKKKKEFQHIHFLVRIECCQFWILANLVD